MRAINLTINLIKQIALTAIGAFLILRTFFQFGTHGLFDNYVYPYYGLMRDARHAGDEASLLLFSGLVINFTNTVLGLLVVSLGFATLKKYRPLLALASLSLLTFILVVVLFLFII